MIRLGNIKLDVPFYQAPLSGYSEWPMRILARRYGAPLAFTGVLLDKTALHPKAIKKLLFHPADDEHPVGAQILGEDPDPATMARAAGVFEKIGFDMIDLNFACPAPKVLRRMRGGYHLKQPHVVIETIQRVREVVSCPTGVKLRVGFDGDEYSRENFRHICEHIHRLGIDMLTIHGRTVTGRYRGKVPERSAAASRRQGWTGSRSRAALSATPGYSPRPVRCWRVGKNRPLPRCRNRAR